MSAAEHEAWTARRRSHEPLIRAAQVEVPDKQAEVVRLLEAAMLDVARWRAERIGDCTELEEFEQRFLDDVTEHLDRAWYAATTIAHDERDDMHRLLEQVAPSPAPPEAQP